MRCRMDGPSSGSHSICGAFRLRHGMHMARAASTHQGDDVVQEVCLPGGHAVQADIVGVHNVYVKVIYDNK